MYVVPVIPSEANANPISTATGTSSTAQGDETRSMPSMTIMNATAYTLPLISAQPISPSATSDGRIGVASTESYSLAYLSRKKMLNVESYMAPFIDETASSPGATNSRYGISGPPGPATFPTSTPSPIPTDSR